MNKLSKLTNNVLFQSFIGDDRGLRVYNKPVSGRLGIPGLTQLVKKVTGQELNHEEAYVFLVKNQNTVKILTRDHRSTSMVEVHDEDAKGIKEEFIQLGLL